MDPEKLYQIIGMVPKGKFVKISSFLLNTTAKSRFISSFKEDVNSNKVLYNDLDFIAFIRKFGSNKYVYILTQENKKTVGSVNVDNVDKVNTFINNSITTSEKLDKINAESIEKISNVVNNVTPGRIEMSPPNNIVNKYIEKAKSLDEFCLYNTIVENGIKIISMAVFEIFIITIRLKKKIKK